jgi:alkylated DNA repair dioxygenase AlkB
MFQQLGLFEIPTCHKFDLPNSDITLYPNFFTEKESDCFFQEFMKKVQWQQDYITFYGRQMPIPRQTAWYGDEGKFYTYSGIKMTPHSWIDPLLQIKERIQGLTSIKFNSVLLNLYRNGQDSVAWHSDDELELGDQPVIGSVSFGATRTFKLKPKDKAIQTVEKMDLTHGSLLLMQGDTQKYWLHQIPKTSKQIGPRINLTFRSIYF